MAEDRHPPCRNCLRVIGRITGTAEWNTVIYHTMSYSRTGVVGKENGIGIGDGMRDGMRESLRDTTRGNS
jgi:hypothetical protein